MRRALLAAGAALVLVPATAHAAPDTQIGFDGIPQDTRVTNQYDSVGVNFGANEDFGLPTTTDECGAPYARTAGIHGTAANIACARPPVEFPERRGNTAFEFSTERRAVSFNLEQQTTSTQTATVKFYGIGGTLLNEQDLTMAPNAITPVSYNHGTTDGGVVGVTIDMPLGYSDSGAILLDDIDATLDDVPPAKKFSIALDDPSVDIVEGGTATAQISVRRFNGSTGPVNLSLGSLPSGIVSGSFSTNPVSGTNPTTLTLRASSPFTGQQQVPIHASVPGGSQAGTQVGVSPSQIVNGVPAVNIASGGRFPLRLVPGCGPQSFNDSFSTRGGFTGSAGISLTNFTGPLTGGTVTPPSVSVPGDGAYDVSYGLDPGNADGSGSFDYGVAPAGATRVTQRINYLTDRVSVAGLSSTSANKPNAASATTVSVFGNFPLGCTISFQDGAGNTWPVLNKTRITYFGKDVDSWQLGLPVKAVSGPLRILGPAGQEVARTAAIDVREFRNTYALQQGNSASGASGTYNWDDFQRTFGTDQTEDCFFVCVRDPDAVAYYKTYQADVTSGGGLCIGYTVMAARFRGFGGIVQKPTDYQSGAKHAWDITPVTDGTAVKRDVVRWYVAQYDTHFGQVRDDASSLSAAAERTRLEDLIDHQGAALISIRNATSGHSVLAYAYRKSGGGLILSIYDPNVPYATGEETNAATRASALKQSTITIKKNGSWSGTSQGWKGPNAKLRVIPELPPSTAHLPFDHSIFDIFDGSAGGGVSPSEVTQIASGGKALLNGSGEPVAGSGLELQPSENGTAAPRYGLAKGRSYALTIRAGATGTYSDGLLGNGSGASVTGADVKAGQVDHLTVRPGSSALGFTTGAARSSVTYELIDSVGKGERTATITLTARKGNGDHASLTNGGLSLSHSGAPTTATVSLGAVGAGLPGSVQTTMKVSGGEKLTLTPKSWKSLTRGVGYTVRSRSGKVRRRGRARLHAARTVKLAKVGAHRKGGKLTITGRVVKRGTAPVLSATAEIVRHGKVLRRRSVARRKKIKVGRFSLPITIGTVPHGARVRVTVLLIDQTTKLATARRTLTIR